MRKLLIALALVAQPVLADSYLMSFTVKSVERLTIEQNLSMPKKSVMQGNLWWGVIDDESPALHKYMDAADSVVVVSRMQHRRLVMLCGVIDGSCIQSILPEKGHD